MAQDQPAAQRDEEQVTEAALNAPADALRVEELTDPEAVKRAASARRASVRATLVQRYGTRLFWLMVGQLFIADVGFFLYASIGVSWNVTASVMNVWLGASVIEVIGVVLVVTRSLFPMEPDE